MPRWWPTLSRLRKRGQPFLPPLPKHSDTALMARVKGTKRRRKLFSRTLVAFIIRWRYFVTAFTMPVVIIGSIGSIKVLTRDAFNDSGKLPSQSAPSLTELNRSIELGERYIKALLKPLGDGSAVQSEASGVPLKAYFPGEKIWVLLGEDKLECSAGKNNCRPTTSVSESDKSPNQDRYKVSFSTQTQRKALELKVDINWKLNADQLRLSLDPKKVMQSVQLWLDNKQIAFYTPKAHGKSSVVLSAKDQSQFRMLRYTVRHATQEAYMYWNTYGQDPARARQLAAFLERNNFTPAFDLRAPLFGMGGGLPDDMPLDDIAYEDCDHLPESGQRAYAYRSKVCLYQEPYVTFGERDPFLQAWQALTVLMKYGDPKHSQPGSDWWMQGESPEEIAKHLQGQWNKSGQGIPKCTPFSCAELSSIRTSVFGALEAQLGYRYGGDKSKKFADAAAKLIVSTQIGTDGKIRYDDGKAYYRPTQAGSFMGAWKPNLDFTAPSTPKLVVAIALWLKDARPTPIEYDSIIPSNSETSLDALGFLSMYRCLRYSVKCT